MLLVLKHYINTINIKQVHFTATLITYTKGSLHHLQIVPMYQDASHAVPPVGVGVVHQYNYLGMGDFFFIILKVPSLQNHCCH